MSGPPSTRPIRAWTIGGAPDCDIIVNRDVVSGHHCRLSQYEGGLELEDLNSTNGTFVNGQALAPRSPRRVTPQDTITLGRAEKFPWPAEVAGRPARGATVAMNDASVRGQWARIVTIGRAPENVQVLDYPAVSWNHARLLEDASGRLFIEDLGSLNGTYTGAARQRVAPNQLTQVQRGDDLFFGSLKASVAELAGPHRLVRGDAIAAQLVIKGQRTLIGRDPSCDYPLDYPAISWHHAELLREGGAIYVRDLGSLNGTFLDGVRVTSKTLVKQGAEVGLGSYRFRLVNANGTFARRDYSGNVTIECAGLTVEVTRQGKRERILSPISLTVFPSELVAVMGNSGAGKTTLLKALNGYTEPASGKVLFNGTDLYRAYDSFRLELGYVPQDDIMHSLLTVEEALWYTAKLRTDLRDEEIRKRVQQVISDLELDDIRNKRIGSAENKVISGGQRKRVNVGMELLSDPSVLFLDEPTSGLSSSDARKVISLLQRLAQKGKTIVVTIHQPSLDIYRLFDNLIMVSKDKKSVLGGALAYYGPAFPDSLEFFRKPGGSATDLSPELLTDGLDDNPTAHWVDKYNQSKTKAEFVNKRAGQMPAGNSAGSPKALRKIGLGQWWTLVQRNTVLRLRDHWQMGLLLGQATAFPVLIAIVFGSLTQADLYKDQNAWMDYTGKLTTVHFLMVIAAIWFGCNNAARDIVGELAIFQRERMVSLKLPSYVFAKVAVLAALGLVQCVILSSVVYGVCHLNAAYPQTLWTLWLSYQVGVAIGLLISALFDTTEAAIAVLPIPLLCMILLGGGIKPLNTMPKVARVVANLSPSRWAYEANVVLEAETHGPPKFDAASNVKLPQSAPSTDVAGIAFPTRATDGSEMQRTPVGICWGWLSAMFALLISSVLGRLRQKDIR